MIYIILSFPLAIVTSLAESWPGLPVDLEQVSLSFFIHKGTSSHLQWYALGCVLTYTLGSNLGDIGNTNVTGINSNLRLHHINRLLNTLLSKDIGVHKGAAETDGTHTKSQQLQGVGTIADTAVGPDLDLVEDVRVLLVDLEGDLEGGLGGVDLSAAVVGEDDGGDLVLDGELGVLDGADALEDDGEVGPLGELVIVFPLFICEHPFRYAMGVSICDHLR